MHSSPGHEGQVNLPLTLSVLAVGILTPGRHVALEIIIVQVLVELILVPWQADGVDVELGIVITILPHLELTSGQSVRLCAGTNGS